MINKKILLASKSPRRRELLSKIGLDFDAVSPECEEITDPSLSPEEAVKSIALQKALWVKENVKVGERVILAADTLVLREGELLGKPLDRSDAFSMLKKLSGSLHEVYTGFAVICGDTLINDFERTKVKFREMSDAEIDEYIDTGEPLDKAGAYGIQELGCVFVERIEGDFFNVLGLPICRIYKILASL